MLCLCNRPPVAEQLRCRLTRSIKAAPVECRFDRVRVADELTLSAGDGVWDLWSTLDARRILDLALLSAVDASFSALAVAKEFCLELMGKLVVL